MKKVIPALMMALALLSTLIFTQCTPKEPEKRPETKEEMLADIEKNYKLKKEKDWGTFYFKEINGIETDDYYSISKTDGSIYKSPLCISEQESANLKNILDKHPEYLERELDVPEFYNGDPEWKAIKTEEKIFIVKCEGKLFPMKKFIIEYENPEVPYCCCKAYFFNLLDGSPVDYYAIKTD